MKVFNKGFNYSQDGPGNRLVYHLQGCNMRCKWCSNPEGMGALCETSEEYSADEIYSEIISCKPMFFDGGGVTFTGGEATLWGKELFGLFARLHENGISICLETNGTYGALIELAQYIDFLIMDIKHYSSQGYMYWTGNDGGSVYENFARLCSAGVPALIRIPLINNVNTDADEFLKLFGGFDCRSMTFEFIPYHEYGRDKWTSEYEMKDAFITQETYEEFKNKFEEKGYKVVRT